MTEKAKSFMEAAKECAEKLSKEQKRYFQLNIGYTNHHFGYGLYLRNHYSYLYGIENEFDRDSIGRRIYNLMLPIIFPEFRGYENYIDRITSFEFDLLNRFYVLKYERNFIADVKPDSFFTLPERSEIGDEDFDEWYEKYKLEDKNYALVIAERIWEFDKFAQKARALGYSRSDIDEIHNICINLLVECNMFVSLEILFAKNAAPQSIAALLEQKEIIKQVFCDGEQNIKQLPSYVFECRAMVKIMVSTRGWLLELAPEYCSDREIVLTAIRSSVSACKFMDKSFRGDVEIAEEAAKNSTHDLMFYYDAFKQFNDDDRIVKLALEANGANICYASERIRADYDMAAFALQHQTEIYPTAAFDSLSDELRGRKDLAMIELKSPCPSVEGFSKELLDDDEIAELLISDEETCTEIYDMSERIQRKYLDRLPEFMQDNIRRRLHIK
ncbi:MAG: DUF4116 domain-containing protein [Ruminiclostridium sp.]